MNTMQLAASRLVVLVLLITAAGCQHDTHVSQSVANGDISACARATKDAAASISAGQLLLKEYPPLPSPPGHGEYIKLLRERCNVEYIVISSTPKGDNSEEFSDAVKCWNKLMKAEIRLRHGEHIFAELHGEAAERWRKNINAKGKK